MRVVVRPVEAQVTPADQVEADEEPGSYSVEEQNAISVRAPGWSEQDLAADELSIVNALRGVPEPGLITLKRVPAKLEILELPDKTELPFKDGVLSLAPGSHELLLKADGYLPKRLSLAINPGEKRDHEVKLEEIPRPALPPTPPVKPQPRPYPVSPPPVSRPWPQPVQRPRPAPQPMPRFTPVAPPPQPRPAEPVPMFTPVP